MTSDPKEALERLKAYAEWLDNPIDGGNPYEALGLEDLKAADLRTLIAKQEGPEREVERLTLQLETTQMQRNSIRTEAEHQGKMRQAAEAQLSALQEAARNILPYLRWTVGPESPGHHPTMPSAVAAFQMAFDLDTPEKRTAATRRVLLPTVPVEGS